MVTSIPSIRCLCYQPERIRILTLSTTKQGTDIGTLVVPFDQTFPPVTCINARSLYRIGPFEVSHDDCKKMTEFDFVR